MTRTLSALQAIVLGLALTLGLGLGGVALFAVGSKQWLWAETFHIEAGFRKIHGVEVGTRVRVLGRDAGEVEEVRLPAQPSGVVTLRLRVDAALRPLLRADASAQIVGEGLIGGKVVEIEPGSDDAPPLADGAAIQTRPTPDLADALAKLHDALQEVRDGNGSLGKLIRSDELHQELVGLVRDGRHTLSSIKMDADAIKEMPIVRGYVKDAHRELVRPDCERNRQVFAESELFEPGQALLTAAGRKRLDDLGPWLNGLKHKGSEVVVVAYAARGSSDEAELARAVCSKQAEVVSDYLISQHAIQKLGWFTWRKVTALGMGTAPPPVPEREKLPPSRIEVVVFVPQR